MDSREEVIAISTDYPDKVTPLSAHASSVRSQHKHPAPVTSSPAHTDTIPSRDASHTQPSSWEQLLSPHAAAETGEELFLANSPPGTEAAVGKVFPRETEGLTGLETPALLFKGLHTLRSVPLACLLFHLQQWGGKLPSLQIHH